MRVLAVSLEDNLFDEFKALVEESGKTQKAYVIGMVERELEAYKQQQQEAEIKEDGNLVKWERESVVLAIDDFLTQNNRVPSQKEFRSDNGLPSYKAAKRCLEQSPAEYCSSRLEGIQASTLEQEPYDDFNMSM